MMFLDKENIFKSNPAGLEKKFKKLLLLLQPEMVKAGKLTLQLSEFLPVLLQHSLVMVSRQVDFSSPVLTGLEPRTS